MRFTIQLLSLAAAATTWTTAYADLGFLDQTSLDQWPIATDQQTVAIAEQLPEQQQPAQAQQFRVLRSDRIKNYAVRVKQPLSCEEGVQYSGYIDNFETDDHLFFWFFESRASPRTDPVVLWLNGGPGCSSMMGAWMELGPCLVDKSGNATVRNEYSWNSVANVVFLDQPVNVGYSYGKSKIRNTKQSARDVSAFLQLFFGEFPEYANNPFHISGESYGGHYLPALASEIIHQNKIAEEGHIHIPFESMLIGNGWTEPRTQLKHYETYSCATDSEYKPLFDEEECEKMRNAYPRCEKLMTACYKFPSSLTCVPAYTYCERTQQGNFDATGLNPYDIRKNCTGDSGLCYDEIDAIGKYANLPEVRWEFGVDDDAGEYSGCSDSVGYRFALTGDGAHDFSKQVAETLDESVRVLLYVGDMDWICNWFGNKAWSLNMEWPGKQGYGQAADEPWYNEKTFKQAGEVRSHDGLTFLRVFDAGHMVPYDQPENALDFFARWLQNAPLNEKPAN
ncbi:Alpha/Beta hydrolase protein [Zychaea mexicana]|uniref:Alpha/Beta hydrolase protein n=1 Tax=Zychaea mexicana TaxID=64656 RepID=UPI0022FDE459|nr:Alpha/Beta hydrolase protein [Zychaea mexicana]KAI9499237.1 Alpha/Beta hydrolase protein [Zychaea mexicana]